DGISRGAPDPGRELPRRGSRAGPATSQRVRAVLPPARNPIALCRPRTVRDGGGLSQEGSPARLTAEHVCLVVDPWAADCRDGDPAVAQERGGQRNHFAPASLALLPVAGHHDGADAIDDAPHFRTVASRLLTGLFSIVHFD